MPQIDFSDLSETVQSLIAAWSGRVIGAIAVILLGRWIAGWVRAATRRSLDATGVDPTLVGFFASLAFTGLILLALLSAAAVLGISITAFVAVLGAVGLALALAFQGTLSNFAAGVMLLTFRPFKVGDFVEAAGVGGTVNEIGVFMSTLSTPDNVRITLPNSEISSAVIKNYSAHATRRIDLVMGVSYDDDLNVAVRTIESVLQGDDRVLPDPSPVVAVNELADASVNLVVRPWVKTSDYWTTRWELTKRLKEALETAGCTIPYPQHDVHLFGEKPEAA